MPARILDHHVGGNTTYARKVAEGLVHRGIAVDRIPKGSHPALTAFHETAAGLRKKRSEEILHYVADTGPLIRTRTPSVVTVHGVASRWIKVARNKRQEAIWRTRVSRAIASTDHVITVSESSRSDVCEVFGVAPENITVIHHGIDAKQFSKPFSLSPATERKIPKDYFLYLGNIEPRKNLAALVEAFESSEIRNLGIPLVIAGKPAWNSREIMQKIQRGRNVTHLGFVDDNDKSALMQRCTCFVFPSLYEGFGFPVLEAMAAGAPVLASRRGSLNEIAGPSMALEDLSSKGIAESVLEFYSRQDEMKSKVSQGRRWADGFSWDSSVAKHVEVYSKVLGEA